MKLMIFASLITSFSMIMSTHPIIMVMIISLQSLLISIMLAYYSQTPWFSLVLFLVFMGGLMVLFVYISSLASNEMFTQTREMNISMVTVIMITSAMVLSSMEAQSNNSMNLSIKESVMKIYNMSNFYMTLLIMLYLLLVLIISVSVINLYEGPLRSLTT